MKNDGTFMRALLYGLVLAGHWVLGPVVVPAQGEATVSKISPSVERRIQEGYGKLPLSFETNEGQTDRSVQFLSRGQGYQLFLTSTEAVLALRTAAVQQVPQTSQTETADQITFRLQLVGANSHPDVRGEDALPGKANYFLGKGPANWRTNVPTYQKVRYQEIYPGIDLVYYGKERQLEYDFVVAPGADPRAITLAFEGQQDIRIDAVGDLILETGAGQVRLHKPLVYQERDGAKEIIASRFFLNDGNQVGFDIAAYDSERPLVIDPVLSYSTFLGGNSNDNAGNIRVDAVGNAYVFGNTLSANFPTTGGVFQGSLAGGNDVFVTKLNSTGTALLYSTYLGGSDFDGAGGTAALALDAAGNVYVTGTTRSSNFPTTAGAFQATFAAGPNDIFVTKIDATGSSLLYSTYLGGPQNDEAGAITVDSAGNAYVTGLGQSGFPTTPGALKTTFTGVGDIFVTKLNPTGTGLVYSTSIPTTSKFGVDVGTAIALDGSGNAYVTGVVRGAIGTTGAFQTAYQGGVNGDAFVLKLNPTGSSLIWATNLGGNSTDGANSIAIDAIGNAYVCGGAESPNFPTTSGAFQTTFAGGLNDGFVTKVNPTGTALVFSTYLGGNGEEGNATCSLDPPSGIIFAQQATASTNMPVTADALQPSSAGGFDGHIAKLNATGSTLLYGSYFGGSSNDFSSGMALDIFGNAYVVGNTSSANFPTTTGAFQTTFGGNVDAFVAKFSFNVPFAAFTPKVEIELGPLANDDELEIKGTLTLGASSDGIAPLTEAVTIQVGSFSATIPAGSFKLKPANPNKPAFFKFEEIINGVAVEAKITPLGANSFEFKAEGQGMNLTGTVNPVTVTLIIGNDRGSATVTAEFE